MRFGLYKVIIASAALNLQDNFVNSVGHHHHHGGILSQSSCDHNEKSEQKLRADIRNAKYHLHTAKETKASLK